MSPSPPLKHGFTQDTTCAPGARQLQTASGQWKPASSSTKWGAGTRSVCEQAACKGKTELTSPTWPWPQEEPGPWA